MTKLKRRIKGCCRVEVCGAFPETVLNACAMGALELWELECADAYTLRFYVYERDVEALESIARRCMCEVKTLDTVGGSRLRAFLRGRMWVFISGVLVLALLALSSLFIWDIDVYGCDTLTEGEVLRALSASGVDCGRCWVGLDVDLVRAEMITREPRLAWMTVNVSSSRAVVLVSERRDKPEIYVESEGADIVASRPGIVRRLAVLNGAPAVGTGQSVTAGETLISGGMESLSRDMRFVRAQGDVVADTWYELSAVCPAETLKKTPHGVRRWRFAVKLGKERYNFYFCSGNTVDGCDKIVHNYKLGVRGLFALPVTLIAEEYIPYGTAGEPTRRADEMGESLEAYLMSRVRGDVKSSSVTAAESGGLMVVTLRAACEENIAELREYTPVQDAP